MNCPPFKRQKRLNDDVPRAVTSEDPFGDDEDFTQDDLDEIDVIASQAFPQVNRPQSIRSDLKDAHSLLEVQHAELKRKVLALQTELQFKEAEINDLKSRLHTSDRKKTAALLPGHREALLLLHWLLLHHCSFSESCRPLLHLYDQVIPAVQDLLRGIPGRSESEEVALEEICRSDGDDPDDVHVDTVS
ncbi:unnamed protein product [Tetraodon nigroviridis]|uniref:(spotted green pufferfish) hypothetical protein n=1 Tax=Tetraodon nigroviridis TaxID=99883 RepID=Q4T7Y2_TETNG|nr:unnamed protein product [Tetraodon nigroviridis]